MTRLSIINTNARSLGPKIGSLVDCMCETEARLAVVTETWFKEGQSLEELKEKLLEESGIGMICLNREPNSNGVAYGGVAVLWKTSRILSRLSSRMLPGTRCW